jgi:hypothetical protein
MSGVITCPDLENINMITLHINFLEFHEVMHQLGIHHEDVLMKMFMYSLEGEACEWFRSLLPSSISSLKYFHVAFNNHCKKYFSADLLFEHCYEQFGSYIQNSIISSSSSENERDILFEEVEEDLVTYESFSNSVIQKDDVGNYINDEINDNKALDTFSIISYVLIRN